MKKIFYIILTAIIVILLLPFIIYLPPIQKWAVNTACEYASEATGMNISIERVTLSFPIDICLENVKATKQNDSLPQRTDTIANVKRAMVDVQLLPLFDSQVKVNAIELLQAKLNTSDFIHEARIKGNVGRLAIENKPTPVVDVNLQTSCIDVASVIMNDAHLNVELSDTVPPDTTKTENEWKIKLKTLRVTDSDVLVHMPGDTLQLGVGIKDLTANNGYFDLKQGLYDIARIALKDSRITYDNNFAAKTSAGLDANHIALNDVSVQIDSIHYCAPDMRMLIRQCTMKEKSGIELSSLIADVALDSTQVRLNGTLKTPASTISTRVEMDLNAFADESPGKLKAFVDASLGKQDLMLAMADMPVAFRNAWPLHPLCIKGEAMGNLLQVTIPQLTVELPTAFAIDARGNAQGFMTLADDIYSKDFRATLHSELKTYNMSFAKTMLDRSIAKMIDIPSLSAIADVNITGADYDINLRANEAKGSLTAKAKANIAAMSYNTSVNANHLNLGHFVKGMQLGSFTGSLTAAGQGTDYKSRRTRLKANANVNHFTYGKYNLNNINADVLMKNGRADMQLTSHNDLVDGTLGLNAIIDTKRLDATFTTELNNADLYKLFLVDVPLNFSLCGHIDVASDFKDYYKVQGLINDITFIDSAKTYRPDDIVMDVLTRTDTTAAKVYCGDFELKLNASSGYMKLLKSTDAISSAISRQLSNRTIDQAELRALLPTMSMHLKCSNDNPIYRLIRYYDLDYSEMHADLETSPAMGINGGMQLNGLSTQGYKLDTLTLALKSSTDPNEIRYTGHAQNTKPNEYVFDVYFDGMLLEHGISMNAEFYDEHNDLGLKLGTEATMVEEGINLHLTPDVPILGYQAFNLNEDNFILFRRDGKIKGYVDLKANDGTGIKIYTSNDDENNRDANIDDDIVERLQDITLSLNKINIGKLLSAVPYAPKANGMIYGDMHFVQEMDRTFSLATDLDIRDLSYEGNKMGNIGLELTYMPKEDGYHYIDGRMSRDGEEVTNINGAYNFDTGIMEADMNFIHFPMNMANGFVPDKIMGLEGFAEGMLSVRGTTDKPIVNGELFLESASLISVPYGVKMRFDDDPVTIENSRLLLENFVMYGSNDSPLLSQGYIDFSDTEHINLNLRMKAENFLLIDAKETRRSEAYGKGYINFYAYMKGELSKLQVRGKLDVLPSTNLFYILRDSPISTDNRLKELVTFTDLNAESPMQIIRPTVDGINIDFAVNVLSGSHIKCWLNDSRSNYLDIIGDGEMRMKYKDEQVTLNGRYTINEGEMKYSLPIIPLKTFKIEEGSYIEFNGDMMNPRLNITARETTKAAVSTETDGVTKLVTFNTGVRISKTLNDMGLEFIIDAPEDQAVSDELKMMSLEERGKIAVTMLTTGMYFSDGNTSAFSMNSALNSFLQSEINNLAGSALRTLDLSFGMDNSTGEDGTLHTNYSFKFAKRFWNNRLSISVGGKISTGPDVSGQNKSFFDNVEVQYRMSDISNQYMRLFYNNSVYDYLEGYVGEYGAGYMWKKKVQNLRDIFHTPATIQYTDSTKNNRKQ